MSPTDRERSPDQPRSATEREWDVFVRHRTSDPVQHVGSVTAQSPDVAHEQAAVLFDSGARDIWVCPADELRRYSAESLAEQPEGHSQHESR